jgi:hypothetical protein
MSIVFGLRLNKQVIGQAPHFSKTKIAALDFSNAAIGVI